MGVSGQASAVVEVLGPAPATGRSFADIPSHHYAEGYYDLSNGLLLTPKGTNAADGIRLGLPAERERR